jgi:hypothetical protein
MPFSAPRINRTLEIGRLTRIPATTGLTHLVFQMLLLRLLASLVSGSHRCG